MRVNVGTMYVVRSEEVQQGSREVLYVSLRHYVMGLLCQSDGMVRARVTIMGRLAKLLRLMDRANNAS